jgi:hypothetical protein
VSKHFTLASNSFPVWLLGKCKRKCRSNTKVGIDWNQNLKEKQYIYIYQGIIRSKTCYNLIRFEKATKYQLSFSKKTKFRKKERKKMLLKLSASN